MTEEGVLLLLSVLDVLLGPEEVEAKDVESVKDVIRDTRFGDWSQNIFSTPCSCNSEKEATNERVEDNDRSMTRHFRPRMVSKVDKAIRVLLWGFWYQLQSFCLNLGISDNYGHWLAINKKGYLAILQWSKWWNCYEYTKQSIRLKINTKSPWFKVVVVVRTEK